jgi:hypothetical protein
VTIIGPTARAKLPKLVKMPIIVPYKINMVTLLTFSKELIYQFTCGLFVACSFENMAKDITFDIE